MAIRDNLGSGGGSSRVENGIKQTTAATLANSAKGGVKIVDIFGACKQAEDPTANNPQYIGHTRFKNMLQITAPTKEINGITAREISDNYGNTTGIKISGTATALTAISIGTITAQKGSYILSGCPSGGSVSSYWLNVATKGNDTGAGVTLEYGEEETNEVFIYVAEGATVDAMFYPMFRSALAENGDFVPYGVMPIRTRGENLLKIPDFELVKPAARTKSFNVGLLSAGTYHIKVELSGTATRVCVKSQYVSSSGNIINDNDYIVLASGDNVFTSSYDFNRLYFFIANEQTDGATASIKNVMFSVNAAEYKPYTEENSYLPDPVELYGIGSVADSLNFDGITRRFVKAKIDSSCDIRASWDSQNTETSLYCEVSMGGGLHKFGECLCNRFIRNEQIWNTSEPSGFQIGSTGNLRFRISDVLEEISVDAFKAWLDENETYVIAELESPITEEISAANKKALCNMPSYDGVTYIECNAEIAPILEVEYGTSRAGALTLENSNEIALNRLAIQEMGGTV